MFPDRTLALQHVTGTVGCRLSQLQHPSTVLFCFCFFFFPFFSFQRYLICHFLLFWLFQSCYFPEFQAGKQQKVSFDAVGRVHRDILTPFLANVISIVAPMASFSSRGLSTLISTSQRSFQRRLVPSSIESVVRRSTTSTSSSRRYPLYQLTEGGGETRVL
ncbi:hypothetical protein VTI74DRAFT_6707 [Chaetomium olivicolor]